MQASLLHSPIGVGVGVGGGVRVGVGVGVGVVMFVDFAHESLV